MVARRQLRSATLRLRAIRAQLSCPWENQPTGPATTIALALSGAARSVERATQETKLRKRVIITWLGLASWRKGDYKDARQQGESALALKLRLHLDADLFKSYNALGLLAWNEGRLADAAALFDTAMATARAHGDREGVGKASGNLGLVFGELGEFSKASEGFAVLRQVGRELKDARIEGNALDNEAMLQIKLGEPASAIPSLLEARRLLSHDQLRKRGAERARPARNGLRRAR